VRHARLVSEETLNQLTIGFGLAVLLACACSRVPSSPSVVTGLTVRCDSLTLTVGQRTRCTAIASYSDSTTTDQTGAAGWSSSNTSVAIVTQGTVTAVAPGGADITARYQNVAAGMTVSVTPGLDK